MPRPIHAVIHQQALQHNLQVARSCAPQSQVFAIVKADAYGHGIERVYAALKVPMVLLFWILLKESVCVP